MTPDFDYQRGASDERAAIVAWLRRRTHLKALADMLERGMHRKPDKDANDYAARNQFGALR